MCGLNDDMVPCHDVDDLFDFPCQFAFFFVEDAQWLNLTPKRVCFDVNGVVMSLSGGVDGVAGVVSCKPDNLCPQSTSILYCSGIISPNHPVKRDTAEGFDTLDIFVDKICLMNGLRHLILEYNCPHSSIAGLARQNKAVSIARMGIRSTVYMEIDGPLQEWVFSNHHSSSSFTGSRLSSLVGLSTIIV